MSLCREKIPADSVILDMMSSWVSHLPPEVSFGLDYEEVYPRSGLVRVVHHGIAVPYLWHLIFSCIWAHLLPTDV